MFKVVKGLSPTNINALFPLKETNNYNLRHKLFFEMLKNETVCNNLYLIIYVTISYLVQEF